MDVHSSLHYWLRKLTDKNGRLMRGARFCQPKLLAAYFFAFLPPFSFSNTAKNSDAMLRMARPIFA